MILFVKLLQNLCVEGIYVNFEEPNNLGLRRPSIKEIGG